MSAVGQQANTFSKLGISINLLNVLLNTKLTSTCSNSAIETLGKGQYETLEICSKLTMKSPERLNTIETPFTCVSIVDLEQINVSWGYVQNSQAVAWKQCCEPFSGWCPLKGHTYLNLQLKVC